MRGKNNGSQRRSRATDLLLPLVEACDRHSRGESLDASHIDLLTRIGWIVIQDEDPRPLFHTTQAGRPSDDRLLWVAIDLFSREDCATKVARGEVAHAWGLSDERVRAVTRKWREQACGLIAVLNDRVAVRRLVEDKRPRPSQTVVRGP
jgi:hypothetical protein